MKKQKTAVDELYTIGLWFLGIGSILLLLYFKFLVPILPKETCFFWNVFGLYCPGCGGTRAIIALLQGEILLSLWYHPFVLYVIVVFGGFMLTQTLARLHIPHVKGWKYHNWYLWVALLIIIGNWILKNILLICFHIML